MALRCLATKDQHVLTDTLGPLERRLFAAVEEGRAADIRSIVGSGDPVDLDALDPGGTTCLERAVRRGHVDVVRTLLQAGADVNKADFYGQTALQYCAEINNLEIANILISAGADVDWNDVDNDGLSALHLAACKGQTDVAAALVKAGANVSATDHNDVSVLHCAVANRHPDIVRLLLAAGADINVTGSRTQRTPLFLAMDVEDEELVDILLTHGARVNIQDDFGLTVLCGACLKNNTSIAKRFLHARSRVNIADNKGNLPLHYSTRNGNLPLSTWLLDAGSPVDRLNCYNDGPLHLAIRRTDIDLIRLLIDRGADVNLCAADDNRTPIHVAVDAISDVSLFETVLQALLLAGATIDNLSNDRSALWRATEDDKEAIAVLLVQHGGDVNLEGPHGITVLHKACRQRMEQLTQHLLHAGLEWTQESWLNVDAYSSGLPHHLVIDYARGIPMALHDKLGLFCAINEAHFTTKSLQHLSRLALRKALKSKIFPLISQLQIPRKLKDFILLKTL